MGVGKGGREEKLVTGGLAGPIPSQEFTFSRDTPRAAHCTRDESLHRPIFSPLDWIPTRVHVSHCPPPSQTGSLTVLQAVLHQVPIYAACPNPIWGPPLEGGGAVCHILHCQVLGFTCGSCKDPEKGEVGVNEGSGVSREAQGSELELLVRKSITVVGQRSVSKDMSQGALKQDIKG